MAKLDGLVDNTFHHKIFIIISPFDDLIDYSYSV